MRWNYLVAERETLEQATGEERKCEKSGKMQEMKNVHAVKTSQETTDMKGNLKSHQGIIEETNMY